MHADVTEKIQHYFATVVLDGKDAGLTPETPLLEWGVLNSLEMIRLVTYIRQEFGLTVPSDQVTAENFQSIQSIAGLVSNLAVTSGAA